MRMLDRQEVAAVAALGLLLIACAGSIAVTLAIRADAAAELSERQTILDRLEARAHPLGKADQQGKVAAAPAQAFLDAATPGLAAADLEAHVARLADRNAALVSFGTQASAGQEAAGVVRIEASLDISLNALQGLLYQLESGTPYVFVDSLTVRAATTVAAAAAENQALRVTLTLHALWRRRPT
jgi:general secretion pathway protein M